MFQGVTASMTVAGQRRGVLFLIDPEGNFSAATHDRPFLPIGAHG